jgi:hypothetical protein
VVVVVVFLTDNNTTPTKVVLSCFGLLVGLWQYEFKWIYLRTRGGGILKESK